MMTYARAPAAAGVIMANETGCCTAMAAPASSSSPPTGASCRYEDDHPAQAALRCATGLRGQGARRDRERARVPIERMVAIG
jgi:hypothetical protein